MARFAEEGGYRLYTVSPVGTRAMPRNWPRLWHEGDFVGAWWAAMNIVVSLAVIGLLGTGLWIWPRRRLRMRAQRLGKRAAA